MQAALRSATEQARKLYGADINVLVARAPAFGNDDTCILVSGDRHAEAAAGLARVLRDARVEEQTQKSYFGCTSTAYSRVVATAKVLGEVTA